MRVALDDIDKLREAAEHNECLMREVDEERNGEGSAT